MLINLAFIIICFVITLCGCETFKKDKEEIKKITNDVIDEVASKEKK